MRERQFAAFLASTAVILFVFASLPTLKGAEKSVEPRIEFAGTTFDFGKVNSGTEASHAFVFTNTGTGVLEITDVKPGCGCTTAGAWERVVLPGKTGTIPLQFNSTGFSGRISKSATVTCNDPLHTNVVLELTGMVWKPVEVTPSLLVFQPNEGDHEKQTKSVRIVSNLDEPLRLSDLRCTNSWLRAELKQIQMGREFELQVTVLPRLPNRFNGSTITLRTSSPQVPDLAVTVSALLQIELAIIPQQLQIAPGPLGDQLTSYVAIINNSKREVTFSAPHVNAAGVAVRIYQPGEGGVVETALSTESAISRVVAPGQQLTLAVSFPAGFRLPDKLELTLKSNHPKYPLLTIPVSKM